MSRGNKVVPGKTSMASSSKNKMRVEKNKSGHLGIKAERAGKWCISGDGTWCSTCKMVLMSCVECGQCPGSQEGC